MQEYRKKEKQRKRLVFTDWSKATELDWKADTRREISIQPQSNQSTQSNRGRINQFTVQIKWARCSEPAKPTETNEQLLTFCSSANNDKYKGNQWKIQTSPIERLTHSNVDSHTLFSWISEFLHANWVEGCSRLAKKRPEKNLCWIELNWLDWIGDFVSKLTGKERLVFLIGFSALGSDSLNKSLRLLIEENRPIFYQERQFFPEL